MTAVLSLTPARGDEGSIRLLGRVWPANPSARLSELGSGVAVVFSPDLSVEGNCRFYQSLGFECFDDADWTRVLDGIRMHNTTRPDRRVRTVILETHGTNGNGLKLQKSYEPSADRSYISVGALQERLEPAGVRTIIISACNSRRLLRPMIYRSLDPDPGDKLFLPATCGIISGSTDSPRRSRVAVLTPSESHIETTLVASVRELAPVTRQILADAANARGIKPPRQFAVSDMLMQMVLRDERLDLQRGTHTDVLSKQIQPAHVSEGLYDSFVALLNARASREKPALTARK